MSVKGIVRNGRVELPEGMSLPEGTSVILTVEDAAPDTLPEWAQGMLALARDRDWPDGYARNLDAC